MCQQMSLKLSKNFANRLIIALKKNQKYKHKLSSKKKWSMLKRLHLNLHIKNQLSQYHQKSSTPSRPLKHNPETHNTYLITT